MSKILCELRICTNIKDTHLFKKGHLSTENTRLTQYINGIKKFLQLNKKYIDDNKMDVYITDNTISHDNKLHQSLLDIIPENIKIITCDNNNYGCINKGAGDIEQWLYCKNLIKQYDYIIHFEPRQLLIDNYFIDNFMKNPRTLLTYNINNTVQKHFNTGLFVCKTVELLNFIELYPPQFLTERKLGIEHVLYFFYNKNKIEYDILDKMSLIWYPSNTDLKHYW